MKGSGGMFSQPRADKCYGASNKLTPDIFVVSFYNLPSEIYTLVQWAMTKLQLMHWRQITHFC